MNPHLRSEKNCLNCGHYVEERYCTHCGQENVEVKESFRHLIGHFFSDLTHYDSKFFTSLKDLLFKPGYLTNEYLAGRRANYLHPIRMYVFVSFLYFLVTLSFNGLESKTEEAIAKTAEQNTRNQIADSLRIMLSIGEKNSINGKIKDSVIKNILAKIDTGTTHNIDFTFIFNVDYKSLIAFDSSQRLLPVQKRERGLKPWMYHRWLHTINLYGIKGTIFRVTDRTEHFIPKMMFVLLPLFALLLKLFYNKKKYYYSDHVIFSLHFHTAVFLIFLVFSILTLLFHSFARDAQNFEYLLVIIYLGIALRRTYGQSSFITILKAIGLTLLYSILILAGYVLLIISAFL
ncbi:MAG TPA: DUF3667 domain-containing protein [Puia sp.]|nr:DUF3667 domain-containing protein [Puia sp.]